MPPSIRVLHVDDEPDFADLTGTFLERENDSFTVQTATSAAEGLACIEEGPPDCIVSDYDMPGQSGIEFLESVRDNWPDLPFILFTGKGSEEVASDAISAGVTDYLQKKSGTDQYTVLANRVQNAVERVRAKQQQERQLEAIKNAQEGISILDEGGRYLFINEAFADMHGYDPSELLGEHWELVYPDADVPEIRQEVLPVVEAAGNWRGETTSLRADGTTFEVDHTLAVTDRGELVCTVRDISEKKEREQRLQQSAAKLEALFENSPDMINIHDMDGNIIDPNPRLCEKTGHDADTLTDMKIWELDQAIDPSEARTLWEEMEVGDRQRLEGEYQQKSGSTFPVEVHIQRLDLAGENQFVVISRDITDRKRTETKRQQIIDRMSDAIIEVDPDWRITMVNSRTEEFSGRTESGLLGRDFWAVFSDARGTQFEDEYRRAMNTREEISIVDYYSNVDEWFDIRVYPNEDGGLSFYFRTVTEYKNRERELQRIERRYQAIFEDPNILAGVLDTDGTLVEQNQTGIEYIDAEVDDIVGEPFWETPWWSEGTRPVVREKVEQAVGGEYVEYEADLEQPDGTPYSVEGAIRPVMDETDEVVSLIVSARDVTQRKEREQTLREVNQRFELLAEAVPNGLFLVVADYSELYYCNSAGEELYGVGVEELQDDPNTWMRNVHPDDIDRLEEDVKAQKNRRIEDTQRQKFRIQHPDRGTRWLEVEVHPVEEDGEVERLAVVATDITEREQRRRTLERYQKIVETMDDVAFVVDDEWNVEFVNETILEYIDVPIEALEGRSVMRLAEEFTAENTDSEQFEQALQRTFHRESEGGMSERVEVTLDLDGRMPIFEYQFSPVVSEGQTAAAVVTMRDITERKEREQELVEARDRMEFALERTDAVIWERDLDTGKITTYPDSCPLMENTVETAKDFIETVHPNDRETVADTVETVTETGEPKQMEYRIDDGSAPKWVETRTEPVSEHGDSVDQLMGLTQDITDRKQREQILKRQNERFDELASAVSHDLQTPLATARGRAELAVETGDTERMEQALDALERVDELRENLVEVLRTKEIINETESVDIERVGRDAWETVQTSDDASVQMRDELSIDADPNAVQRLLENLLSNAIEHGGANTTVRIGGIEDGFYVEDDGPGITEDERDEVFTPGYSTKSGGSGVGLASVRQIVMAHDWEIHITESSEGGARFEITEVGSFMYNR